MGTRPSRVDLFCRVVDNFGDIGVCWRLARQLAVEEGLRVRLVVDRLDVARVLVPEIAPGGIRQVVNGVTIEPWTDAGLRCETDLVIEAFACELPADYLASMSAQETPPLWINLEYLSAESWVAGHHGLPSPHPGLPLTKYFFFPGFTKGTGGLLRERTVVAPPPPSSLEPPSRILAFAYDFEGIETLVASLASLGSRATVHVPAQDREAKLKHWRAARGKTASNAAPGLEFIDFVPQASFDNLLAAHDLLLVRGEDSLVRALWSARPFVWQPYRQEGNAHLTKLGAFLEFYGREMPVALRNAWRDFSLAWNRAPGASIPEAWLALSHRWPEWVAFSRERALQQMREPDLASNLLSFFGKLAKI